MVKQSWGVDLNAPQRNRNGEYRRVAGPVVRDGDEGGGWLLVFGSLVFGLSRSLFFLKGALFVSMAVIDGGDGGVLAGIVSAGGGGLRRGGRLYWTDAILGYLFCRVAARYGPIERWQETAYPHTGGDRKFLSFLDVVGDEIAHLYALRGETFQPSAMAVRLQVMIVASGVHSWVLHAPGLHKYPRLERLALEAGLLLTQPLGPPGLVRP